MPFLQRWSGGEDVYVAGHFFLKKRVGGWVGGANVRLQKIVHNTGPNCKTDFVFDSAWA